MSQDLDTQQLLEPAAPTGPAVVGHPPATTTAGNTAALNATKESLEDYTLRFAPRSYRKWSAGVVATSALGGIAYLADFSIGANIGISYGTVNAILGIVVAAVVIFATGFPLAYYAARYNIDLDLITRGSGFGYYGSVVTNVIFATFTFINGLWSVKMSPSIGWVSIVEPAGATSASVLAATGPLKAKAPSRSWGRLVYQA